MRLFVGVPDIVHVLTFRFAHDGRDGLIEQFEIVAPFELRFVGATSIGIPTVPLVPVTPVKLIVGAEAPTFNVTVAEFESEELLTVTVNVDEARIADGGPEISQVVLLLDAQDGSAGETMQLESVSPPPFKVEGVTIIGIPTFPLLPELEE